MSWVTHSPHQCTTPAPSIPTKIAFSAQRLRVLPLDTPPPKCDPLAVLNTCCLGNACVPGCMSWWGGGGIRGAAQQVHPRCISCMYCHPSATALRRRYGSTRWQPTACPATKHSATTGDEVSAMLWAPWVPHAAAATPAAEHLRCTHAATSVWHLRTTRASHAETYTNTHSAPVPAPNQHLHRRQCNLHWTDAAPRPYSQAGHAPQRGADTAPGTTPLVHPTPIPQLVRIPRSVPAMGTSPASVPALGTSPAHHGEQVPQSHQPVPPTRADTVTTRPPAPIRRPAAPRQRAAMPRRPVRHPALPTGAGHDAGGASRQPLQRRGWRGPACCIRGPLAGPALAAPRGCS
jgi:hypothetical protein